MVWQGGSAREICTVASANASATTLSFLHKSVATKVHNVKTRKQETEVGWLRIYVRTEFHGYEAGKIKYLTNG